ncbi:MAG: RsmE family RNA methyltransferase, partial [Patescibacteria group bacterium]
MQRFLFPHVPGPTVTTDDEGLVHQLTRVLRSKPGDRVVLFSESGGGEYEISAIEKKKLSFVRIREIEVSADPKTKITLFQALPNKYEKLEYAIQKGVEVGVSDFVFFPSERSQKLAITDNKIERFEAIAREAVEQCYGFRMPTLHFEKAFPKIPEGVRSMFLHTDSESTKPFSGFLASLPKDCRHVALFVGPEGGFSPEEVRKAMAEGAVPVKAGERILRTETAGPAMA